MEDSNGMDVVAEPARNYFRLARLTLVAGTEQVRRCVIERLPGGETLHTSLQRYRDKMNQLYQRRVISDKQMSVLYPNDTNADLSRIDISLWIILLRNLLSLARLGIRNVKWNEAPPNDQKEWYHDILRIRETRNNLSHVNRPELDNDSFENLWGYTAGALSRLDGTINLDEYRNTCLDRAALKAFQQQVNEQVLQERNSFLQEQLERRQRLVYYILLFVVVVIIIVAALAVVVVRLTSAERSCLYSLQNIEVGDRASMEWMPRDGWTTVSADRSKMTKLDMPVPYVFYTHTADTGKCSATQECCSQLLNIQYQQMHTKNLSFGDIAYHYIIDSSGVVYSGRDQQYVSDSAAVKVWTPNLINVGLIGNYMYDTPQPISLGAFDLVLYYLIVNKYVVSNFTLYALCEVYNTNSPGINLYKTLDSICDNKTSRAIYPYICTHLGHMHQRNRCTFDIVSKQCDDKCYY